VEEASGYSGAVYPTYHALATALVALPLRASGVSWGAIAQFSAGSVLIDGDHYLAYVAHTGDLHLRRAYLFHRNRVKRDEARFAPNLHVPRLLPGRNRPAHAMVVMAALAGIAVRFPVLRPVVAGILFHRLQDYVWEASRVGPGRDE
jgi:hypothetical protein